MAGLEDFFNGGLSDDPAALLKKLESLDADELNKIFLLQSLLGGGGQRGGFRQGGFFGGGQGSGRFGKVIPDIVQGPPLGTNNFAPQGGRFMGGNPFEPDFRGDIFRNSLLLASKIGDKITQSQRKTNSLKEKKQTSG
jgi:hypothetical protein